MPLLPLLPLLPLPLPPLTPVVVLAHKNPARKFSICTCVLGQCWYGSSRRTWVMSLRSCAPHAWGSDRAFDLDRLYVRIIVRAAMHEQPP